MPAKMIRYQLLFRKEQLRIKASRNIHWFQFAAKNKMYLLDNFAKLK